MDNRSIRDRIEDMREWISEHAKIVMPVILLVCVAVTVFVAVGANRKAAEEVEAQMADIPGQKVEPIQEQAQEAEAVPQLELEENAYPEVNALISRYYEAVAQGDVDTVVSINEFMEEKEKLRIREMGKYIDSYPELTVYTKKGPVEDSYIAYVYSKMKFTEYERLVPGMQAFYVCTDENGECYINEGVVNSIELQYITDVSLQDDVVDLNNRITVEYNDMLASDEELRAYLTDLSERVDVSVGEALAKAEDEAVKQQEEAAQEAAAEEGGTETAQAPEETQAETPVSVATTVKATSVVNVRSSDSETADKVGKAQVGDEFPLLEERGNGWSKITFEGKDAFIKSEYLEKVTGELASNDGGGNAATPAETPKPAETQTQSTSSSTGTGGTVTVKTSVNVRKSASEDGEKLGLAYEGDKLELVMKQADGWTRVKYNGQTAFVKSDFVE